MSVQASSWVWEHSESSGTARLVLLAIADHADRYGRNAWPSQATLADVCRLSVRTVRRLVADLVALGELEVVEHGGPSYRDDRRPHLYALTRMGGAGGQDDRPHHPTGGQDGTDGRTGGAPRADTDVRQTILLDPPSKTPSGGAGPPACPADSEDAPMPTDQPGLFSTPKTTSATKPPSPSAATVTAAYVDAYRRAHSGGDPLKADIGRVARDAKAILGRGEAGPDELAAAATAMGAGPYANLGMALKIHRDRGNPARKGMARATPHSDPAWEAARERDVEFVERLRSDGPLRAWVAEDPAALAELLGKHPDLVVLFDADSLVGAS